MPVGKILYQSLQWKSLQFFTSFVVNIIFARTLHSAVAGEFYSFVYLLSLIISLFTLGLDISLNYYLSRKEMSGAAARRILIGVSTMALLISLPLLWFWHSYGPDLDTPQLLLFSGGQIAGGLLTALAGALFTAAGKNHIPAVIASIFNSLLIALSLYCSLRLTGPDHRQTLIHTLFSLYFVFSFGQGVLLFFLSCRLTFVRRRSSLRLMEILRFSFFAFLTNLMFYIAARLYIYILPYFLSTRRLGNYIQAYKIVEYMGLAMSFMYYPFIAMVAGEDGEGREKLKDHLLMLVRLSNTVVLLFSIIAMVAGDWLFHFLFGPSFDRMSGIINGFIPGLFAVCSSGFFTAWFFGSGHIRYNFISACIQLCSMPLCFFLCNGPAGPEGAALAFSFSSLLALCYDLWVFRRIFPFRLSSALFAGSDDLRVLSRLVKSIFVPRK